MSSNKVEMSLDDIIKENRSKGKGTKKGNRRDSKASNGILRRGKKISKPPVRKNRLQEDKASNPPRTAPKRVVRTPKQTPATVATKRLVQKLVKKALAQSNVQTPTISNRVGPQRPKFRGAGRVIRKALVVNRFKLNPRSRIISRRPRGGAVIQKVVEVGGRGRTRYAPNIERAGVIRGVNYAPVATRPVLVRTTPRMVVQQQRQRPQVPVVYQPRNIMQARPSVRDHISQLRTVAGRRQAAPQVVYVTQPQRQQRGPRRQNFRQQQQVSNFQPQQRRQLQRRNNFSNQRPLKISPFFDPPNFLQRLPVVQSIPQNTMRNMRRY